MLQKYFRGLLICLILTVACNKKETLYKVVKVKDGDTVELLSPDNQNITVRLAEVDAPEKSQAFGQAAKQFTAELCFGKMVKLIGNTKDRYGRTVAQIELEDGTNVNYEIVKKGFAWQYLAYSHNMELAGLEQQAREHKLGLWQDVNPTPPWNFRRDEKSLRANKRIESKAKKAVKRYHKRRKKRLDTAMYY